MKRVLMPVLVVFLCVNVGVLYYMVFTDLGEFERRLDLMDQRLSSVIRRETPVEPEVKQVPDEIVLLTDQQKDELASMATVAMEKKINKLVKRQVAAELADDGSVKSTGGVKEYFIPFGQAKVNTGGGDWVDTPLSAEIDMGNYQGVKSVVLEATLRVPSGNGQVGVRLFNASGGYAVAGSELFGEGVEGEFKRSGKLVLAAGRKSYKLQMKTTMDYDGWLDMGRLKLVVE